MDYNYESEYTKFLRELREKDPQLIEKQKIARSIWWDKKVNKDEYKRFKESNVPQESYVYFEEWFK